jgi:catechol 2,3-dioxygenase-like lactoylglutathione lyase family enzyme
VADPTEIPVSEISAITLVVIDMSASVQFYTRMGFDIVYGGSDAAFTSLKIGANFVNLQHTGAVPGTGWGRVIFHVDSPDDVHATAASHGYGAETDPTDAPWGERYFHILDPDGHELSFARRIS